jgi:hypothetical protein
MLSQAPKLTNCPGSLMSRTRRRRPAPGMLLAQPANRSHAAMKASSLPAFGLQVPEV